ncbi:MAG: Stk1 family PASTA domain-containing Ser/Thr kinase, partial [Abditibacteriales bacterium]|nr:Stk1 family PASTA domain-containing Ser/Thr kinase [Abditibacteriales bacterium]
MGVVYEGHDPMIDRTVAIKTILPAQLRGGERDAMLARFRREAQSAASLSHANIAAVYDIGKHGDMPYIVMELVEGSNLQEVLKREGTLPVARAVKIAAQVCAALAHAHAKGIIHRDIKPHNILLSDGDQVKVTDFGIARARAAETITKTHALIGTVAYISPEQAKGEPATPASDLYALGVVLYEMLTGRVPFTGETPVAIALKHLSEPPVPPSQYRPDLPPALEQVILKALSKDQTVRHVTAQELLRDLQMLSPDGYGAVAHLQPSTPAVPFDPDRTQLIPRPVLPATGVAEPERKEPWMEKTAVRPRVAVSPRVMRAADVPRRGAPWAAIVGIGALLAILVGGTTGILMNTSAPSSSPVHTTVVPNLIGQDTTLATQLLRQARLHWGTKKLVPNDSVPRGHILEQDPPPGTQVPQGSSVNVVISQGPPIQIISVPDVTEMSRSKAESILEGSRLALGSVREEYSDHTPAGYVMSQSPRAGARVEQGTPIDLIISKGPEPAPPTAEVTIMPPQDGDQIATVKVTLPPMPAAQRVKIVFRDESESETVWYDQSHVGGEHFEFSREVTGSGEIRVYIEDTLVKAQRVGAGE